jgi:hypothetical protein
MTFTRLKRRSFDKEQGFYIHRCIVNIGARPEKLESEYQIVSLFIFPHPLNNMVMIIKNITSLTGLQILGCAWTSGNF